MKCPECRTGELYQFEPGDRHVDPSQLPTVCRDCGRITVGGIHVPLPEAMEAQAKELAGAAAAVAKEAREDLEASGGQRIEAYMSRYYVKAYLDGFFRALAFFRHNAREGRIFRIRRIWGRFIEEYRSKTQIQLWLDLDLYEELCKLLGGEPHHVVTLDAGGVDGESSSNKCPAGPEGSAPV